MRAKVRFFFFLFCLRCTRSSFSCCAALWVEGGAWAAATARPNDATKNQLPDTNKSKLIKSQRTDGRKKWRMPNKNFSGKWKRERFLFVLAVHSVNCKHAKNNDEIVQQFKTVLALLIFRLNYLVHNCSDNRNHAAAPFVPFYLDGDEDRRQLRQNSKHV